MFGTRARLFELYGSTIRIDLNWIFLAPLLTWSLAQGYFPEYYLGLADATYWWMGAFGALDGLVCRLFDEQALAILRREVDDIVAVDDGAVADAMRSYFSDTHNLVEGACAAPLAALLKDTERKGAKFAVIASGGNIDRDAYLSALAGG